MKNYISLLFFITMFGVHAQEVAKITKADLNEKVYRSPEVDTKPQLKDGLLTLSAFIGNNFKFPDIKNKKVKIFASFIVEPDGSMSDVRIFYINVSDLVLSETVPVATEAQNMADEKNLIALKTETVRVLSSFTERWIPAQYQGKLVRCLYNYPLNFNLE